MNSTDSAEIPLTTRQLRPLVPNLRVLWGGHRAVRRLVKNWWSLDRGLFSYAMDSAFEKSMARRRVRLRDPPTELWCRYKDDPYFLERAIDLSNRLLPGPEVVDSVTSLLRTAQQAKDRLYSGFSAGEIQEGKLGGWPSQKEIVLSLLVQRLDIKEALETGVAQGISSWFLLSALRRNGGKLTSIDLPNYNPEGLVYSGPEAHRDKVVVKRELGSGWIVPDELRPDWTLLLGSTQEWLPKLGDRTFDLFYHDSEHSYQNMTFEYEWGLEHLRPGGLLLSDDIDRNTAFPDFVKRHEGSITVLSSARLGIVSKV
jgi:predicted O-methyltransferase YrrM